MRTVLRAMADECSRAARNFPAVVLTGPRRVGKTSLLRHTFPHASWVLLEDPDVIARVRSDPRGFLDGLTLPVILDEIQNAPELLPYIRTRIDHAPDAMGRWLITGSQEFPLMRGVTESMAGRVAVLRLLPLGAEEAADVSVLGGGFPEVALAPEVRGHLWFESYLQTYVERDLRALVNVSSVSLFRRFLAVLASRTGQLLNKTDIASPLGVSVPTIASWLDALEATGVLLVVPPWFTNFGKRMLKSPRVYFCDSGLTCHLLGLSDAAALERSPLLGAVVEGFVATEIVKHRIFAGRRPSVYWFRDQQGLEVDFLLEGPGLQPVLIEAKASHTPRPEDARGIRSLRAASPTAEAEDYVVYRGTGGTVPLTPGVLGVDIHSLHERLRARGL